MAPDKWISHFLVLATFSGPVWGTVAANIECPVQVRATAREVRAPAGADHSMAKQIVRFEVDETLKGEASRDIEVEILKYGPMQVEVGHQYDVQLNQQKLCWLEAL